MGAESAAERLRLLPAHGREEDEDDVLEEADAGGLSRQARRSRRAACWLAAFAGLVLAPLAVWLCLTRPAAPLAAPAGPLAECQVLNVSAAPDGFTLVLNTFRRNACLRLAFEHWGRCAAVRQVRVSWSDVERRPPAWLAACAAAEPERFVVDAYHFNRLSNRFRPLPSAPSEALFSVDDDVMFECALVAEAHAEWRRLRAQPPSARAAPLAAATGEAGSAGASPMVGFAPRLLRPSGGYDHMAAFQHPFSKNTLFATKGAFLHREDYGLLWQPRFAPLVQQVDAHTTAEDIVLSVIFAAARGLRPVHVAAHRSQVTELCCTGSTPRSDGLAAVSPHSLAAQSADPTCRRARGSTLHQRTAAFRGAIQQQAVRLAGGAIYRLNASAVTVLPSTRAALRNASGAGGGLRRANARLGFAAVR